MVGCQEKHSGHRLYRKLSCQKHPLSTLGFYLDAIVASYIHDCIMPETLPSTLGAFPSMDKRKKQKRYGLANAYRWQRDFHKGERYATPTRNDPFGQL